MVHAQVLEECIKVSSMYKNHHIFNVVPINHMINQDGGTTKPHKLATGMNNSISNQCVLFCTCVVQKKIHTCMDRR